MDQAVLRHSEAGLVAAPAAREGARAYRVVLVEEAAGLADHAGAWNDLAATAAEPNPFHEPWFLLPALKAFASGTRLQFAFVYAQAGSAQPQLCGFFPLERAHRCLGLPLHHLRLWRPQHAHLGTPLVREGSAEGALGALHDWLEGDARGASVMEWGQMSADGPAYAALGRVHSRRGLSRLASHIESRALMKPGANAEQYLGQVISAKSRKELRRLERRLGECGTVAYDQLDAGDDAERWIADFLALESAGWKGRNGSALGSTPACRRFFVHAAAEAARRGRLAMLALRVDGRPVAMRCGFTAGEGAFAFRTTYDETCARYSPGLLLEVEHIRRFHGPEAPAWMDSCAPPEPVSQRLWRDRRELATLVAATRARQGNFTIALLRMAQGCSRLVRGR